MQRNIVLIATFIVSIIGDYVSHDDRASSFQNLHFHHYHSVPVYIRKEDTHFLDDPISIGDSSSKVSIEHGTKNTPAQATVTIESDVHSNPQHNVEMYNTDDARQNEYSNQDEIEQNQSTNNDENISQNYNTAEQYSTMTHTTYHSPEYYGHNHEYNNQKEYKAQKYDEENMEEEEKPTLLGLRQQFYQKYTPNNFPKGYLPIPSPDPMSLVALADKLVNI